MSKKEIKTVQSSDLNVALIEAITIDSENLNSIDKKKAFTEAMVFTSRFKECNPSDSDTVSYLKQYYTYFCTKYSWEEMPQVFKDNFISLQHAPKHSCKRVVLNEALNDCHTDFQKDFGVVVGELRTWAYHIEE